MYVLKSDAVEETATSEFKATRQIRQFQEGFFDASCEVALTIGAIGTRDKAFKVIAQTKRESWLKRQQIEVLRWVMGAIGQRSNVVLAGGAKRTGHM